MEVRNTRSVNSNLHTYIHNSSHALLEIFKSFQTSLFFLFNPIERIVRFSSLFKALRECRQVNKYNIRSVL